MLAHFDIYHFFSLTFEKVWSGVRSIGTFLNRKVAWVKANPSVLFFFSTQAQLYSVVSFSKKRIEKTKSANYCGLNANQNWKVWTRFKLQSECQIESAVTELGIWIRVKVRQFSVKLDCFSWLLTMSRQFHEKFALFEREYRQLAFLSL